MPRSVVSSTALFSSDSITEVQNILRDEYPSFMELIAENKAVWKAIGDDSGGDGDGGGEGEGEGGFTLFVPNERAFDELGQKRREQLRDARNLETAERIGHYHVVPSDAVSSERLFDAGGIVTMAGEVPVGRSVRGGFFGLGGTEDGGVTVNGSNVVRTLEVGTYGIIHVVDGLISPQLLWRYADQLRIPGSS